MAHHGYKRPILLASIMALITAIGIGITIISLYRVSVQQTQSDLADTVQSRVRFLGAVAEFDSQYSTNYPGGSRAATLSQLRKALGKFDGFGDTGEYTVAYLDQGEIHFILGHRHAVPGHEHVGVEPPDDNTPYGRVWLTIPLSSPTADPMRHALQGESGTLVGLDYRGEEVIAAYGFSDPLKLGVVAKIDMREIRAPFIRAGKLVSLIALALIFGGTGLFFWVSEPLVRQLRGNEERLRNIIDQAPVPMLIIAAHGEITHLNTQFSKTFGWSWRDIKTLTDWWIRAYPDSEERREAKLAWLAMIEASQRDQGVARTAHWRVATRNIERRDVEVAMTSLKDVTVVSLIDVTERNRVEQEVRYHRNNLEVLVQERTAELQKQAQLLRVAEERLHSSLAFAKIGAWDWDIKSGKVHWSEEMGPLFGLAQHSQNITYTEALATVHPDDKDEVENALNACISKGVPFDVEHRVVWQDGTIHWVRNRGGGVQDKSGETVRMFGVLQDISAHKQLLLEQEYAQAMLEAQAGNLARIAEELEKSRAEAEEANKAKSSFLAVMSHEIRTPLNGVIGMVDMLKETSLSGEQRHMVTTIRESSLSLLYIINDILDFSKIEAGKLELDVAPVSLRNIMDVSGITFGTIARKKSVDLLLYEDPGIPACVYADGDRLRQIILNLLGNAIKFTDTTDGKRGRVVLSAELARDVEDIDDACALTIKVMDTGVGISEEAQDRLFQSFSQADETINRRFGGTGLGLAICRSLVEMMGGEIGVESRLGEGSTFSVVLRLKRADDACEQRGKPDVSGVLAAIYSDDDAHCGYLCRYMEAAGIDVVVVDQVQDLPEAAQRGPDGEKGVRVAIVDYGGDLTEDGDGVVSVVGELIKGGVSCMSTRVARADWPHEIQDKIVSVSAYPVGAQPFLQGLSVAAGLESPDVLGRAEDTAIEPLPVPAIDEAELDGKLILLAEDNLVNQDVIIRQLNLLGYAAIVAENGEEALKLIEQRGVGLILTDLHMPVLDGYGLAKTVREQEQDGRKRTPILAITAAALKSELDHCYQVGMDGYVTKPVVLKDLRKELEVWLPRAGPPLAISQADGLGGHLEQGPLSVTEKSGNSPVDPEVLGQIVGNDPAVQAALIKDFLESTEPLLDELDEMFEKRDADNYGDLAHRLKSTVRTFGAKALGNLFEKLEHAGKAHDWQVIEKFHDRARPGFLEVKSYYEA